MDFVNYENFIATVGRQVSGRFEKIPDFFNASVGSTIDFKNVRGVSFCDFRAERARIAWFVVNSTLAVKCPGKNTGRTGLADTPGAGEQESVSYPTGVNSVLQGAADMFLPCQFRE